MASQPQTPAQPTQPTVVTSVKQKCWAPRLALEYPCNPPPPPQGGRPSRARGGDFKGGEGSMFGKTIKLMRFNDDWAQGAQFTPSHCPPEGKCQLQWRL